MFCISCGKKLNDNYNFVNLDEALSYFEKRDLNDDEYNILV